MKNEKDYSGSFEINPILQKMRTNPVANNGVGKYFTTRSGDKLYYRVWKSDSQNKIVVGIHGMAAHSEYYIQVADQLIDKSISVYALDLKQHGHSVGKKGDLKSFKEIIEHVDQFIDNIIKTNKDTPIYLMGISMGGVIAINYSVEIQDKDDDKIKGMILMAPGVKTKLKLSFTDILKLPFYVLVYLVKSDKLIINIVERSAVGSRNPLRLDYQNEDELRIQKVSLRYLLGLNSYKKVALKNAKNIIHPVIIFQGTEDNLVSYEGVKAFFEEIPIEDKTFIELDGAYHSLYSDPAMIEKGYEKLRNWLLKH
ncbi:MAG: alpha/beta fold hydrolase [Promethearchaeota archaeon]|nr:MAG: alpha/beta fold hydrolase [Candidatus Lokiarchaeota archaeon]